MMNQNNNNKDMDMDKIPYQQPPPWRGSTLGRVDAEDRQPDKMLGWCIVIIR